MTLRELIEDRILKICMLGFITVCIYVIGVISDMGIALIISVEIFVWIVAAINFAVDYILINRRIRNLNNIVDEIPDKYLAGELMPKPQNELERLYFNLMRQISKSAISTVEQTYKDKDEYCEYVENWVHEIKTPLTACSLILDNDGDLAKIRCELKRADNTTENILYYARYRNTHNDTVIRRFCVADVINNAIKSQMSLLIAAGIGISIDGDFELASDDKALNYIICQFLVNSAKYCPGCHIIIKADTGTITYEDNGIGIPDYDLPRIFERGFTGHNGRTSGNSTGMGMYIVHGLCDDLGITLKAESEVNKYTRFILSFDSLTKM